MSVFTSVSSRDSVLSGVSGLIPATTGEAVVMLSSRSSRSGSGAVEAGSSTTDELEGGTRAGDEIVLASGAGAAAGAGAGAGEGAGAGGGGNPRGVARRGGPAFAGDPAAGSGAGRASAGADTTAGPRTVFSSVSSVGGSSERAGARA